MTPLTAFTREESRHLSILMMKFAHSAQCAGAMQATIAESLQHHGALIEELRIAASSESFQNVFYAWFIFDRPITNDGQCLADVFLSGHRLRMKEVSVNFLEHMRSSSLRPYVVCEVELEKGLVLRDLRDDMFVRVLERAATRYARHGATLFARVIEGPSGEPEMHGVLSFAAANMGKM